MIPWLPFDRWANRKYYFHDTTLSPLIENAIHAISIDEPHRNFDVTLIEQLPNHPAEQQLLQVWFPGDHMSVGGGSYYRRRLSDLSLLWMIEQIQAWNLGLAFNLDQIAGGLDPDFTTDIPDDIPPIFGVGGKISRKVTGTFDDIHLSVKQRWHKRSDYRPSNLEQFRSELEQWQASSLERT